MTDSIVYFPKQLKSYLLLCVYFLKFQGLFYVFSHDYTFSVGVINNENDFSDIQTNASHPSSH